MKNEEFQNKLKDLIIKIQQKISLDCVILFGSRARGDYTPYSDIDMIFIGNFKEKFINRSSLILEQFDFHLGIGIDAFCYTPNEFKKMFIEGIVSILDSIDHGICLYGFEFYNQYRKWLEHLKTKGLRRDPPVWFLPEKMTFD
jgi:predicted nucleotidyltransferase